MVGAHFVGYSAWSAWVKELERGKAVRINTYNRKHTFACDKATQTEKQ